MDPLIAGLPQCLPTPTQTLLLRAALLSGETAREAWESWTKRMGDLRSALAGKDRLWIKRLLPLLLFSVKRNRLPADAKLVTLLKLAYAAEAVRDAFCRRAGTEVLRQLTAETLPPVVIRGFAFSETVYQEPCLRHCDDIDLFVAHGSTSQARNVLLRLNFSPQREIHRDPLRFVHTSGLPVILHRHLFPAGIDALLLAEVLYRCESRLIAGTTAKVLCPTDALLYACTHAWSARACFSPMWVCDAWFLLARLRSSDWTFACDLARRACIEKPLYLTLQYLATELEAPIPASIASDDLRGKCLS